MGKFVPDVDIDVANRDIALEGLHYTPASMLQNGELRRHNVGVYFQPIPLDPLTGFAALPYETAESKGYFKVDFLNLNIYKDVRDEKHLETLISTPPMWELLLDKTICESLYQLGGKIDDIPTYDLVEAYYPQTVEDLAIFLAMIRPRKKHLIGKDWDEVKSEIWTPGDDNLYGFKKAHSVAYAMVIVVQLNLLQEQVLAEA